MAKKTSSNMSKTARGKIESAYRAVVTAKSSCRNKVWSILHRVESELARALGLRSKISHPKKASGTKGKKRKS